MAQTGRGPQRPESRDPPGWLDGEPPWRAHRPTEVRHLPRWCGKQANAPGRGRRPRASAPPFVAPAPERALTGRQALRPPFRGSRLGQQLLQEHGPADQGVAGFPDAGSIGRFTARASWIRSPTLAAAWVTSRTSTRRRREISSMSGMRHPLVSRAPGAVMSRAGAADVRRTGESGGAGPRRGHTGPQKEQKRPANLGTARQCSVRLFVLAQQPDSAITAA
jgi:hypothetical protein